MHHDYYHPLHYHHRYHYSYCHLDHRDHVDQLIAVTRDSLVMSQPLRTRSTATTTNTTTSTSTNNTSAYAHHGHGHGHHGAHDHDDDDDDRDEAEGDGDEAYDGRPTADLSASSSSISSTGKLLTAEMLKGMSPQSQTRVFYRMLADVEDFMMMFDHLIMRQTGHDDVSASSLQSQSSSSCSASASSSSSSSSEAEVVVALYEIMSGMEGMYAFLMRFAEDWQRRTKEWLQRMLRRHMALPVMRPTVLQTVIQCLMRENMLFSSETVQTIRNVR